MTRWKNLALASVVPSWLLRLCGMHGEIAQQAAIVREYTKLDIEEQSLKLFDVLTVRSDWDKTQAGVANDLVADIFKAIEPSVLTQEALDAVFTDMAALVESAKNGAFTVDEFLTGLKTIQAALSKPAEG